MKNMKNTILAFMAGAAAGIALGILFAPGKGSETRKKLAGYKKKMSKEMKKQFEDKVTEWENKLHAEAKM
jgi:gas vesicle protein